VTTDSQKNWLGLSQLHQPQSGILQNWLSVVATDNPISPPAVVIRRSAYEQLGGFHGGFISSSAEDWELFKRVAVFYDWWFEPEVLACYRQHSESITYQDLSIRLRTADIHTNIEMTHEYMPMEVRDQITAIAKRTYALFALKRSLGMINSDDLDGALREIQAGLRISSEPIVVNALFQEVLLQSGAEPLRQAIAELLIDLAIFNDSES
jgi:protein O-GlcNAc transferase